VLKVESQLTGDTAAEDAAFTFTMTAEDKAAPMPSSDTVTITGAGTAEFGPITYDEVGEYKYTIRERDDQLPGYTYDTTVYHVTVLVASESSGALRADVIVQKNADSSKSGSIIFSNEYRTQEKETEAETTKETESETTKETEAETTKETEAETTKETKATKETKETKETKSSNPKTGDTMNLALCFAVVLISGTTAGAILLHRRKQK
jgi:pilin isopeptide linkage protein